RSNIAGEARAKMIYERLMNFTVDADTRDALQFLMTREIAHMKAFSAALESLSKPPFMIGKIPRTAGLVDQFFNTSTGEGEHAEIDVRGPWNEGEDVEFVESPALQVLQRQSRQDRSSPLSMIAGRMWLMSRSYQRPSHCSVRTPKPYSPAA